LRPFFIRLAYVYAQDPVTLLALRMTFALPFFVAIAAWSGRDRHKEGQCEGHPQREQRHRVLGVDVGKADEERPQCEADNAHDRQCDADEAIGRIAG